MPNKVGTGCEIKATLVAKAQSDASFRAALIKNPKAAIEKELGASLPAGVEWKVLEESATTNYLVLPTADESSDAELESVAGGNRAIQANSNIASKHNKTADALVQNIRG